MFTKTKTGKNLLTTQVIELQQNAIENNTYGEFSEALMEELLKLAVDPQTKSIASSIDFITLNSTQILNPLINNLIFNGAKTKTYKHWSINSSNDKDYVEVKIEFEFENFNSKLNQLFKNIGAENPTETDRNLLQEAKLKEAKAAEEALLANI